jgi:uncharacterized membrane protein YkgB
MRAFLGWIWRLGVLWMGSYTSVYLMFILAHLSSGSVLQITIGNLSFLVWEPNQYIVWLELSMAFWAFLGLGRLLLREMLWGW